MAVTPTVSRTDFSQFSIIKATVTALSTATADVFGGPCRLLAVHVVNGDAAVLYLKLFDNLDPTLGTTDPDEIFAVGSSANKPVAEFPNGKAFKNGLSLGFVTTGGTAGTTGATGASTVTLVVKPGVS
jgi:hypothetical protein